MSTSTTTPLRAIAARTKFRLDRQAATKLAELDRVHVLAMQSLGDLATTDLRGVWEGLQRRATDALKKAENVDQVAEIAEPTKESVQRAAASQRASLKNSLRVISQEAHELAAPEVRKYLLAAQQHLVDLEDAQLELARSYGTEPMPNPIFAAIRAELGRLEARVGRPWNGAIVRPASFVESFAPLSE